MKVNDNVKIIKLEEEDLGYGIEEGCTGVIIKEDENNEFEQDDIFNVKLNCEITGKPANLEQDGSYLFYRNQIEVI